MRWMLSMVGGLLVVSCLSAAEWRQDPKMTEIFARHKAEGTFVVYDARDGEFIGHNPVRAETRFIPASTFKIANTLISLDSGTVDSVDSVIPFVGEPQENKAWEKDMSLRDAIAISNVPLYQELARQIGLSTMESGIRALQYGNCEIGETVDTFWLRGPLEISAVEQCLFLDRLANQMLPVPPEMQKEVAQILELGRGDNWVMYGKTGATGAYSPSLGWWVGWVLKDGRTYPFALNMDMPDYQTGLPKRLEIGKACLASLGLLPD